MIGEVIGVRTDEDGSKITVRSKDSGEEFDLEKWSGPMRNIR